MGSAGRIDPFSIVGSDVPAERFTTFTVCPAAEGVPVSPHFQYAPSPPPPPSGEEEADEEETSVASSNGVRAWLAIAAAGVAAVNL